MVRGPASLLTGVLLVLLAPALPDASAGVAGAAGALAVALCALALLPARDEPIGLMVLAAGGVLLAAALSRAGVGAGATPVEALFAAAAGLLFAYAFPLPAALVAVPLLVAGIDLAASIGRDDAPLGGDADVLTLTLPGWGDGPEVEASLLDATFLAMYAAWAVRFALRPRLTVPLLGLALALAVALGAATESAVPVLPFLAAALLLPAAGRVRALLRGGGGS